MLTIFRGTVLFVDHSGPIGIHCSKPQQNGEIFVVPFSKASHVCTNVSLYINMYITNYYNIYLYIICLYPPKEGNTNKWIA